MAEGTDNKEEKTVAKKEKEEGAAAAAGDSGDAKGAEAKQPEAVGEESAPPAATPEKQPQPAGSKVRDLVKYVEEKNLRKDLPHFQVGDTLRVSLKVAEKDKTRIQNFDGIVTRRTGRGPSEVFTVRRISFGVGVEKTFPVNSPNIAGIKVLRAGVVRRARLYYLRGLSGREARIKEDEKRLAQAKVARSGRKKAKTAVGREGKEKLAKRRAAKGKKKDKRAARRKAKSGKVK